MNAREALHLATVVVALVTSFGIIESVPSHSIAPGNCPGSHDPSKPDCPLCICDGTTYRHPYECEWYYECEAQWPVLKHCPGGFHWNDRYKVCDYPCLAGCVSNNTIPDPPTDPPLTVPPFTYPPVTDPPRTYPTYPPVTDPPRTYPTYPPVTDPPRTYPTYPPVTDPPRTYPTYPPVTDPPRTYPTYPPVTDPPRTYPTYPPVTDPPRTYPTYPPVTDPPVTRSPVTDPPITNPPVTVTPATESPETVPPTETSASGVCPDGPLPTCPNPDPAMAVYFPHPNSCHWYFECSNGTPYCMPCPSHLHWNSDLNVCDWPDVEDCSVGKA